MVKSMYKKLILVLLPLALSACIGLNHPSENVELYSRNNVFPVDAGRIDKVIVDGLAILVGEDGSRIGIHYESLGGIESNVSPKDYFKLIFGRGTASNKDVLSTRTVIYKNIDFSEEISTGDITAYHLIYNNGIKKVVFHDQRNPDVYGVIEAQGRDAVRVFSEMRHR